LEIVVRRFLGGHLRAAGDRAFCAGADVAEVAATEAYRMNCTHGTYGSRPS